MLVLVLVLVANIVNYRIGFTCFLFLICNVDMGWGWCSAAATWLAKPQAQGA
jgi:hypothetical protein